MVEILWYKPFPWSRSCSPRRRPQAVPQRPASQRMLVQAEACFLFHATQLHCKRGCFIRGRPKLSYNALIESFPYILDPTFFYSICLINIKFWMTYWITHAASRSCLPKGWNFGFSVCREVFSGVSVIRLEAADLGLEYTGLRYLGNLG